jgi:hypothetical protein
LTLRLPHVVKLDDNVIIYLEHCKAKVDVRPHRSATATPPGWGPHLDLEILSFAIDGEPQEVRHGDKASFTAPLYRDIPSRRRQELSGPAAFRKS